jgi:hypothetical protein
VPTTDASKGSTESLFSFLGFTETLSATSLSFFRFFFDGFSFGAASDFSVFSFLDELALTVLALEPFGLPFPDFSFRRKKYSITCSTRHLVIQFRQCKR